MATRTRTLPSWLVNVGETNGAKEIATRRGKQPAKRTINKTPKKEAPARGNTVKTTPVKNLGFSESEDEENDIATSPKRKKEDNIADSKLTGKKLLAISDSEEEIDKDLVTKTVDEIMTSNGLLHDRDSPITTIKSNEENDVISKSTTKKPLLTSDGEEEADKLPEAGGSVKDSDNLPHSGDVSSEKPCAINDGNEWNKLEIKSSPVHEDISDAEDAVATKCRPNEEDSNSKTEFDGGDGQKENSDGGNTSAVQTADNRDSNASRRPACKYGSSCYRKNSQHLQDFSHPGNADYSTVDNRPECEYGTACYRKNPLHRQHYKHTKTPPVQNAKQSKRQKQRHHGSDHDSDSDSDDQGSSSRRHKKRQTKHPKTTNKDDDDDEDDYDFDDPFLNDASSDDYAPTDSGSETDFSGAQSGSGDEEEDAKRTQKEAKKFLRKKK